MKCTECSKHVKPVIAVDIDGTLGMYHEHFTAFASDYVGKQLRTGYPGGEEFSDYLGMSKQSYREAKLAYRQGGMKRSMPTHVGARAFMKEVWELGFEIWIATTRPWMRLDNIDPDTREWLFRNGIQYDYMIYGEDKYEQLVKAVGGERIVLVIDDLRDQCFEAMKQLRMEKSKEPVATWPVVQPQRVHNRRELFANNFYEFNSLKMRLEGRLEGWYDQAGSSVRSD